MKIVHSRRRGAVVSVPIRGGFRAEFQGGRAILPDDVADTLAAMGGGFYHIAGPLLPALQNAKILIIRDTGLGDVLMITPLMRSLHLVHAALVDVLTHERYRCLFQGNPHVRSTFPLEREFECDKASYDIVLDLRLVVENAEAFGYRRHRADAFAAYADIALTPEERRPDYFVSDAERGEELPQGLHDSRAHGSAVSGETHPEWAGTVAYVWRSSTGNRNWSDATHAAALGALIDAGYQVLVLDNEPQRLSTFDIPLARPETRFALLTDLTGVLSLREVAAVLEKADVVVTPDTGLFHLAAAVGTPTVAYFGPFPAAERQSHKRLTVLNAPASCALFPCRSYRCLHRGETGQPVCLDVAPATLVDAVHAALDAGASALLQETNQETDDDRLDRAQTRPDTPADDAKQEQTCGDDRELDGQAADVQGIDSGEAGQA